MSLIGAWITNIILVILFAFILELLLPNSKIERYVKLVVGLMLLVVMLQPLLSIFQLEPEKWLKEISSLEWEPSSFEASSIDSQKMEIQLDNLAYISEYMAIQLANEARAQLQQNYEVVLVDVNVQFEQYKDLQQYESDKDLLDNLSSVYVLIQRENERNRDEGEVEIVVIDPVEIKKESSNDVISATDDEETDEIKQFLANIWMIPKEKLVLEMKGGEE